MYERILVPLDGSSFAESALPPALSLARKFSARVEVVSVQEALPGVDLSEWGVEARKDWESYLAAVEQRIEAETGVDAATTLRVGSVEDEVLDQIADTDASLVVLASHGRGPFSRFWIGSVADALLRRSKVPLLLVRPQEEESDIEIQGDPIDLTGPKMLHRVLIPLDGSDEAEAVIPKVRQLIPASELELLLLRVVHFPSGFVSTYPPEMMSLTDEMVAEGQTSAREYLDVLENRLSSEGLEVESRVEVDVHPATAIVDVANTEDVDLIAMATHGRKGLERALLGSVTDKVTRSTHRPILAVPPNGRSSPPG